MAIGAVSSLIRDTLFGITSERIGLSLRAKLFEALIRKDVSFYDDNRTGDICKWAKNNVVFSIETPVRHLGSSGRTFFERFFFYKVLLHDRWHGSSHVYLQLETYSLCFASNYPKSLQQQSVHELLPKVQWGIPKIEGWNDRSCLRNVCERANSESLCRWKRLY